MIGDRDFMLSKRAVNCDNENVSQGKSISEKAKARGVVRRSIEQIQEAIKFNKTWGGE
jgi:hypothetical protein